MLERVQWAVETLGSMLVILVLWFVDDGSCCWLHVDYVGCAWNRALSFCVGEVEEREW